MSRKDCRKVKILSRVKDGLITVGRAGELLGLSHRQAKRLWKRYCEEGEEALIHRARGAGNGTFAWPVGIAVSSTGNIVVTDYVGCLVQEFSPAP